MITGDDGHVYYIKESVWKQYRVPFESLKEETQAMFLQGTALAAMPEHHDAPTAHQDPDPLGFCYLIGLSSLRTKTIFQRQHEWTQEDEEALKAHAEAAKA